MRELCPARTEYEYIQDSIAAYGSAILWDRDIPEACMMCIQRALGAADVALSQKSVVFPDMDLSEQNVTVHTGLTVFDTSERRVLEDRAEDESDCTIESVETLFYCPREEHAY